jgi:hypothetical protein
MLNMIDVVPFGTSVSENAGDEPPHHLKLISNADALDALPIRRTNADTAARSLICNLPRQPPNNTFEPGPVNRMELLR